MTRQSEDTGQPPATLAIMAAKKRPPAPDRADLYELFAKLVGLPRRPGRKGAIGGHIEHWGVREELDAFIDAVEWAHSLIGSQLEGYPLEGLRQAKQRLEDRSPQGRAQYRLVCTIETAAKNLADGQFNARAFRVLLCIVDRRLSALPDDFVMEQLQRLTRAPQKGRRAGALMSAARVAAALCIEARSVLLPPNHEATTTRTKIRTAEDVVTDAFEQVVRRTRKPKKGSVAT